MRGMGRIFKRGQSTGSRTTIGARSTEKARVRRARVRRASCSRSGSVKAAVDNSSDRTRKANVRGYREHAAHRLRDQRQAICRIRSLSIKHLSEFFALERAIDITPDA